MMSLLFFISNIFFHVEFMGILRNRPKMSRIKENYTCVATFKGGPKEYYYFSGWSSIKQCDHVCVTWSSDWKTAERRCEGKTEGTWGGCASALEELIGNDEMTSPQFFRGFVWCSSWPRLPAGSIIKHPGCGSVCTSWTPVSVDNRCTTASLHLAAG